MLVNEPDFALISTQQATFTTGTISLLLNVGSPVARARTGCMGSTREGICRRRRRIFRIASRRESCFPALVSRCGTALPPPHFVPLHAYPAVCLEARSWCWLQLALMPLVLPRHHRHHHIHHCVQCPAPTAASHAARRSFRRCPLLSADEHASPHGRARSTSQPRWAAAAHTARHRISPQRMICSLEKPFGRKQGCTWCAPVTAVKC